MSQTASIREKDLSAISTESIGQAQSDANTKTVSIAKARAPAKLILSGEHAVVYGHPAIAVAIDVYAESIVSRNKNNLLGFDFANLKYNAKHTLGTLGKLKNKALVDYNRFLHGECSIREVVHKPFELLQFAVSNFIDKLNIALPGGVDIKINSDIPTGCGLGSSAATIMSLLYAVGSLLDLNISKERYIELGKTAENLQHGKSSGLDIYLAVDGGSIKFQEGKYKNIDISVNDFYLVNTGRPAVTTGECVSRVKKYFKTSNIGLDFENITNEFEQALAQQVNNQDQIKLLIHKNHKLLDAIGVVPNKIGQFINAIEKQGFAAKVCGAGAVSGDNAGAVLVYCPESIQKQALNKIVSQYSYDLRAIGLDSHGIRV